MPLADFNVGPDGNLAIVAQTTEADVTTALHLRFTGVEDLRWTPDAVPEPELGDLIEFSVVEIERVGSGWRIWLNPWYLREVAFRCASITLDGAEVVGTGRWLQADLPVRSAR